MILACCGGSQEITATALQSKDLYSLGLRRIYSYCPPDAILQFSFVVRMELLNVDVIETHFLQIAPGESEERFAFRFKRFRMWFGYPDSRPHRNLKAAKVLKHSNMANQHLHRSSIDV